MIPSGTFDRYWNVGVLLLMLGYANPALAQYERCPGKPNAHVIGRTTETLPSGDIKRTTRCECDDGYNENQGQCQKSPGGSVAIQRVTGSGEYYFLLSDGRRLPGQTVQQIPLPVDGSVKMITGSDGHMRITLPDDTIFVVGPNSDMQLDTFVYDPNTSAGKIAASIAKGTFRYVTGKIARKDPSQVKVRLAVGTIGVRGTDYECFVAPGGSGYIKLFSGQIILTQNNGKDINLEAGEMISFSSAGGISGPVRFQ